MSLLLLLRNWALGAGTPPVFIRRRNELILGPRYASREGDTGSTYYVSMRDRRRLTKFNGADIVSETTLGGRGGQTVFTDGPDIAPPIIGPPVFVAGEPIPVPSLVDAALWLGVYDFASDPSPNLVTAAPALAMGTTSGATISGGTLNFNNSTQSGVADIAGTPYTAISFAFFATFTSAITQCFTSPKGSNFPRAYVNAAAFFDPAGTLISGYTSPAIIDGAPHHYAWVYNLSTGALLVYTDGVLTQSLTGAAFGAQSSTGLEINTNIGTNTITIDNAVWYKGLLSPAAISALAAGHMPDAAGSLS